jgi:hypothetical protein
LPPNSKATELTGFAEHGAQNTVQVLRLLVENEIHRLNVWNNPTNDPKRGVDSVGTIEKSMTDVGDSLVAHSLPIAQYFDRRCGLRLLDKLGNWTQV